MAPNFCPNCGCTVEDRALAACGECGQDFKDFDKDEDEDFDESFDESEGVDDLQTEATQDSFVRTEDPTEQTPVLDAPKKRWTARITSGVTLVFYLYWFGVMLAVPYFNWSY